MKKRLISVVICVVLLCVTGVVSAQTVDAAPFPAWASNFQVRANVPFVWLRQGASVYSPILSTAPTGTKFVAAIPPTGESNIMYDTDWQQWWIYIQWNDKAGWVEAGSLNPIPVSSNSAKNWAANNTVQVRAQIPFVWLRTSPASGASIAGTVLRGGRLVILGTPQRDSTNTQWWWQVRDPNTFAVGFVEENSLEYVSSRPPTSTPIPPSEWREGYMVRTKRSLPFVWVRHMPHFNSGPLYTIRSSDELVLGMGVEVDPMQQRWRQVFLQNSSVTGWVEENSLEFVRIATRF